MGKDGIPYFPLDTLLDSKFELIEAEFGLTGFGVVVKLYQSIYGQQGYYLEWTDEVALLFARKIGLGGSVVSEIVSASIKRGIFDQRLYENYQVLTSKGIQERYFEAVSRRKKVEVKERYLLVPATQKYKNVDIKRENADILEENVDILKQRKEEKRKGEKISAKAQTLHFVPPTLEQVAAYCEERGNTVNPEAFVSFYESKGWMVGKNRMKDWKAAVRTWEQKEKPGSERRRRILD